MSIQAVAWVLESANVSKPNLLPVLFGLANHADQNGGGSHPSVQTLAWYARKSERQVQKDLRDIEALGLIRPGNQDIALYLPEAVRPVVYDLAMAFAPEQNRERPPKRRKGRPTRENKKPPVVHDTPISSPVCPTKNPLSYTTPGVIQGKNPLSCTTPEPKALTEKDLPYPSQEMGIFEQALEHRKANCRHGRPANCRACQTSPRGVRKLERLLAEESARLEREAERKSERERENLIKAELSASWCGQCDGPNIADRWVKERSARCPRCHPVALVKTATT